MAGDVASPRVVVVAPARPSTPPCSRATGRASRRGSSSSARGRSIDEVEAGDAAHRAALRDRVAAPSRPTGAAPASSAADLDRFLFEPSDVVVTVGPSGLVANVAKYLDGQPVHRRQSRIRRYDGAVLGPAPRRRCAAADPRRRRRSGARLEERTMVEARRSTTASGVLALNEVFVGHRIAPVGALPAPLRRAASEHQSSSGIVVTTGSARRGPGRVANGDGAATAPGRGGQREPAPAIWTA